MARQGIKFEGTVTEALPGGFFLVNLDSGREVRVRASGRMQGGGGSRRIKIVPGDRVEVSFSPYDLINGQITFRYAGQRKPAVEEEIVAEEKAEAEEESSADKAEEAEKKPSSEET